MRSKMTKWHQLKSSLHSLWISKCPEYGSVVWEVKLPSAFFFCTFWNHALQVDNFLPPAGSSTFKYLKMLSYNTCFAGLSYLISELEYHCRSSEEQVMGQTSYDSRQIFTGGRSGSQWGPCKHGRKLKQWGGHPLSVISSLTNAHCKIQMFSSSQAHSFSCWLESIYCNKYHHQLGPGGSHFPCVMLVSSLVH
jgi:hypothetical protein